MGSLLHSKIGQQPPQSRDTKADDQTSDLEVSLGRFRPAQIHPVRDGRDSAMATSVCQRRRFP
jgi:hypothetical protein